MKTYFNQTKMFSSLIPGHYPRNDTIFFTHLSFGKTLPITSPDNYNNQGHNGHQSHKGHREDFMHIHRIKKDIKIIKDIMSITDNIDNTVDLNSSPKMRSLNLILAVLLQKCYTKL